MRTTSCSSVGLTIGYPKQLVVIIICR